MKLHNSCYDDRGAALVSGLMFLAILSVLGTTAYLISSNDLKISHNYRAAKQAFYDAEAGVNYALGQIEIGLKAGSFSLPSTDGASVSLGGFSMPSDFFFTLSSLTRDAANSYRFTSTGNSNSNATSSVEVKFKRGAAISFAAFGNTMINYKSFAQVYSYDSDVVANPTPADSTGEADIGSNGEVSLKNDTVIDGDVLLGNDGSADATYTTTGTPAVSGEEGATVGPVDPDPLGVIGGEYAAKFVTYSDPAYNDNGTIPYSVDESGTLTLTGKPGGANYYFTDITLKSGATLAIDTTLGEVNIFLTGTLEAKNGSNIWDINPNGAPSDFSIFSNSTDSLVLKHDSDFKGLIYAPYATVEMKNSADCYGAIWADTVDGKNSSKLYFDTSIKDKYSSNEVLLTSWNNIRN